MMLDWLMPWWGWGADSEHEWSEFLHQIYAPEESNQFNGASPTRIS
jgi:hypothetical protein